MSESGEVAVGRAGVCGGEEWLEGGGGGGGEALRCGESDVVGPVWWVAGGVGGGEGREPAGLGGVGALVSGRSWLRPAPAEPVSCPPDLSKSFSSSSLLSFRICLST